CSDEEAVARLDEAGEMPGGEEAAVLRAHREGGEPRARDGVDQRDHLPFRNLLAEVPGEGDEARLLGEDEAVVRRHVEEAARGRLRLSGEDAGVPQHVGDAAPGDGDGARACGAATAELGGAEDLAHLLGGPVVPADPRELAPSHAYG